jgi:hypothetical protein
MGIQMVLLRNPVESQGFGRIPWTQLAQDSLAFPYEYSNELLDSLQGCEFNGHWNELQREVLRI